MAREPSRILRGLANSPGPACLRTEEREQERGREGEKRERERTSSGERTCQRDSSMEGKPVRDWDRVSWRDTEEHAEAGRERDDTKEGGERGCRLPPRVKGAWVRKGEVVQGGSLRLWRGVGIRAHTHAHTGTGLGAGGEGWAEPVHTQVCTEHQLFARRWTDRCLCMPPGSVWGCGVMEDGGTDVTT